MKIATVVPAVLALVFGMLYVFAQLRIAELEKEKLALEEKLQPQIATLQSKITALEAKQAKAANSPDSKSSAAGGAEMAGAVPGIGNSESNPFEGFAKMMSDPGMKSVMEQQTRTMVNGIYADILKDLGLDEELEARVKEIVTTKATIGASLGFRMMDKTLDKEGRKEIAREVRDEMDELTEASKELLSDEQFEQLQLFEKSQPDRQALEVFKGSLAEDVAELSYEQEEQMIALMYEERSNHDFSNGDFSDQMNIDPEKLDDFNAQTVETYLEETKDLHSKINARASGVLDDGQMDAFRSSQESYFQMQAMGMRMGAQMMESQPEK